MIDGHLLHALPWLQSKIICKRNSKNSMVADYTKIPIIDTKKTKSSLFFSTPPEVIPNNSQLNNIANKNTKQKKQRQ